MTGPRNQSAQNRAARNRVARNSTAWIWVAIAALSIASVSRAESSLQSAKAYAHPVLEFLASQNQHGDANTGVPRFAQRGYLVHETGVGTWMAILPVFFIGLVAPLNLVSTRSRRCLGYTPAAPLLPASFQRPPPSLV